MASNRDSDVIHVEIAIPAPVWSTIPAQTYFHDTEADLDLNDYVSGDTPITIAVSGLPTGLTASDGVITGSSSVDGVYTITVTATNVGGSTETTFDICISEEVIVPVWSTLARQEIAYEGAIDLDLNDFVMGGGTIVITASGLPDGVSLSSGELSGTSLVDEGLHEVTLTATNSVGSADTTLDIEIETIRFYLIDNTANRIGVYGTGGTEALSRRVDLPTTAWVGGFPRAGNFNVIDDSVERVRVFGEDGVENVSQRIQLPTSIAWAGGFYYDGDIYLVDDTNNQLRKFGTDGTEDEASPFPIDLGTGFWSGGFGFGGFAYLTDFVSNQIHKFSLTDGTEDTADPFPIDPSFGSARGGFYYDGDIYTVDELNDELRKFALSDGVEDTDSPFPIDLGTGSWQGGFAFSSFFTAPSWDTIDDQEFVIEEDVSFDVSDFITSGDSPITFSASGLPSGLSIDSDTGVISGTAPDSGSTNTVTVMAENDGGSADTTFDLEIIAVSVPVWSTVEIGTWRTDQSSTLDLNEFVSGGGTMVITHESGTLEDDLSFVNGVISGNPRNGRDFELTFRATNEVGSADVTFTLTIVGVGTMSAGLTLGERMAGDTFNIDLYATNFLNVDSSSFVSTNIPAGVGPGPSFNFTTGHITGTLRDDGQLAYGEYIYNFRVTNSEGNRNAQFIFTVVGS